MKFLTVILLSAAPTLARSADINYETLSNRFVTSVKEAQVDADFLKIQEVQDCVAQNSITEVDVKVKSDIEKKQRDAANCLRAKLSAVDDGKLTELGEKLQLDAYGVVKGKSNQALVDYLSGRLEKALYGTEGSGPNAKVVRLGQHVKHRLAREKIRTRRRSKASALAANQATGIKNGSPRRNRVAEQNAVRSRRA